MNPTSRPEPIHSSRRARLHAATVLLAALVVLASSCSFLGLDPKSSKQAELDRHRKVWNARGLGDYQYVFQRFCFCGDDATRAMLVTVHADAISSVVYAENGTPVAPGIAQDAPSIPGLFDLVQSALDRRAYQLTAQYDPTYGFPTQIGVDLAINAVDDEVTYGASNFQTLPPSGR